MIFRTAALVLGLASLLGSMYYLWLDTTRIELEVNGSPIANAEQVLEDAEVSMLAIAKADGAPVSDDANCHFGPGPAGPTVFCGPLWLGISREDRPWLRYNVSYSSTPEGVQAELDMSPTPADADTQTFRRPDRGRPVAVSTPNYPTTGRRTERGTLLLDEQSILSGIEAALSIAASRAEADGVTTGDDARCFFREGPKLIRDVVATDNVIWCGPARSATSDREAQWVRANGFWADGPTVGSVIFDNIGTFDWRPVALRDDSRLVDADGNQPPTDLDTDRPQRSEDLTEIVAGVADVATTGDGRLVTSSYAMEFSGFARSEQFGSGAGSFTAAEGFQFVVATMSPLERTPRVRGSINVDGLDRPLPDWPRDTTEGATIVVSVPNDTELVELVVEDNGRPQIISLIDGAKRPGYPMAFYRPSAQPGIAFTRSIPMPTGEPVIFDGRLSTAEWAPYIDSFDWLSEGDSYLTLAIDEFSVDRPCCDVTISDAVTNFALIVPATTSSDKADANEDEDSGTPSTSARFEDLREDPNGNPRSRSPYFIIPETITEITLQITYTITIDTGTTTETISDAQEINLELP